MPSPIHHLSRANITRSPTIAEVFVLIVVPKNLNIYKYTFKYLYFKLLVFIREHIILLLYIFFNVFEIHTYYLLFLIYYSYYSWNFEHRCILVTHKFDLYFVSNIISDKSDHRYFNYFSQSNHESNVLMTMKFVNTF